jgi:hypothetical protein
MSRAVWNVQDSRYKLTCRALIWIVVDGLDIVIMFLVWRAGLL